MRLTQEQVTQIQESIIRHVGKRAGIYLFGSRLDDQRKGGDIDLLIESETALSLICRAKIKMELEPLLMAPVDIVSYSLDRQPTPFQKIARSTAIPLESRI